MSFGRFGRFECSGSAQSAGAAPMSEINVTPLVDVMMVLLVIFIITAPLMFSALKLDLPKTEGAAASSAPPSVVHLSVDAQGALYWREATGREAAISLNALRTRLQAQSAQALAAQSEPPELQLRAHAQVPYGRVAELMGLAQQAGISRIGFLTQPQSP